MLYCHSLYCRLAHLKVGRGSVEVSILLRFPFFLLVNECAAGEVFFKTLWKVCKFVSQDELQVAPPVT